MKTFTITLPNEKTDSTGIYKNYLLKRLLTSYPELVIDGIDTEESPYSYQYLGPNNRIVFGSDKWCSDEAGWNRERCLYIAFAET